MSNSFSRRDALRAALLAGGAAALSSGALPIGPAAPLRPPEGGAGARPRALRLAHMTDIHIQPELRAADGFAAALRHMQSLSDKPELVITGGDMVMDTLACDDARAKLQGELFTKTYKNECSLPIQHTLGNHDIWGWQKSRSKMTGAEPSYGKRRAMDVLGMAKSYHSFDRAGWRIICLDSVQPDPNDADGYIGRLDDEQFAWLESDLKATPATTPVLIVSHIPILSITVILNDADPKTNLREVNGGVLHVDSAKIRSLFSRHPNVKLAVSGHIHRLDRVDFQGVTYVCNGAISGSWWKGPNAEASEGYAVIDLFDDGTFANQYVPYGWKADRTAK